MRQADILNIPQEEKALEILEKEAEERRADLYDPRAPRLEAVRIRSTANPPGEHIDRVIDYTNEIKEKRAELEAKKQRAARVFSRLDHIARLILTLHYIEGISWQEVADIMAISKATLYRKRLEALEALAGELTDEQTADELANEQTNEQAPE